MSRYHLSAAMAKPERQRRAGHVVATNIALHCPHASLDGGKVCVPPTPEEQAAQNFCSKYKTVCGTVGDAPAYTDCVKQVLAMPAGKKGDTGVNTMSCRSYHLGVAESGAAAAHCKHAAADGGRVCDDRDAALLANQETFCAAYDSRCSSVSGKYGDCLAEVDKMAAGNATDTTGDTLACRVRFLPQSLAECVPCTIPLRNAWWICLGSLILEGSPVRDLSAWQYIACTRDGPGA